MYRILFTGSRSWIDWGIMIEAISKHIKENDLAQDEVVFVHGACPSGADSMADYLGKTWEVQVEAHKANWNLHGRAAGFIRNKEMVELGADVCLAFQVDRSKGTQHTINLAREAGIPVKVYEIFT